MSEGALIEVEPRACWIAGRAEPGEGIRTVRHPFDGTEVADVAVPGAAQVERAVTAATAVAGPFATLLVSQRAAALTAVAAGLASRAEEIAETITAESGKPLTWAEAEVEHAVTVFRTAAAETGRRTGELTRPDTQPDGAGGLALVRRRPRGPALAIGPYGHPLGLVARPVAAAWAVGAPVIVKPASTTPLTALLLGEILVEVGLPAGAFSVLPLAGTDLRSLVADPRLPVIAFAGSAATGTAIVKAAPGKHLVRIAGGVGAAVVCADWCSDRDLDIAAERIAVVGCAGAEPSGVAMRQVFVHRSLAERFVPRLVAAVAALHTGDPHDPAVQVGPMRDEVAAEQVANGIAEARAAGARLLVGGVRSGSVVTPAVLLDVPAKRPELCGPVLAVSIVDDVPPLLTGVTRYGLFTRDTSNAFRIAEDATVAGVVVGDVPTDPDGVRSTMAAFTRDQTIVLPGATS